MSKSTSKTPSQPEPENAAPTLGRLLKETVKGFGPHIERLNDIHARKQIGPEEIELACEACGIVVLLIRVLRLMWLSDSAAAAEAKEISKKLGAKD